MARGKALVAGATGMVGTRIVERLLDQAWQVVGLCRHPPEARGGPTYLELDIADAEACRSRLAAIGDATHLFYAARAPHAETGIEPVMDIGIAGRDGGQIGAGSVSAHPGCFEAAVAAYFAHLLEGPVECYEWPGIHALNFVLHHSLGGGGTASLRNDPQGKAYAQMLLDLPIRVPASWGL